MSSKNLAKRKGDSAPAPQAKKQKESGADAKPAAAAPQKKKKQQEKKQPQPKQPEPEPEEAESSADEEGGEVDEAALAAIEKVAPAAEKLAEQLSELDSAMAAEIYAIQKKFLLKRRPLLQQRDALLAKSCPGLWGALLANTDVFAAQMDEVDHGILGSLRSVQVEEQYAGEKDAKQQVTGVHITFGFEAGEHVKAGKFTKKFAYDDETENLVCVKAAETPFAPSFAKEHGDSFFLNWFASEGEDDGVLAAQDALVSELIVDPLQAYTIVAQGGSLSGMQDDEDDAMEFGADDSDDDEEAPQLVD